MGKREVKWEVGMAVAVVEHPQTSGNLPTRRKVEAVLTTQIRLDDGSRWLKDSGREFGKGGLWRWRTVEPWTQKHDAKIAKREAEVATLRARCIEAISSVEEWRVRRAAVELGVAGGAK